MNSGLVKQLSLFFKNETMRNNIFLKNYFVMNPEGLILYSHKIDCDGIVLGALLSGIILAQEALIKHCFSNSSNDVFPKMPIFAGNSKDGIMIIPIDTPFGTIYLGHQYQDALNPGYIRFQIRSLANSIEKILEKDKILKVEDSKNDHLFPQLQDFEIDQLFQFREQPNVHG